MATSVTITVDVLDASRRSARGIPAVLFIDDVDKLLEERKVTVEPVLESLQVMHQCVRGARAPRRASGGGCPLGACAGGGRAGGGRPRARAGAGRGPPPRRAALHASPPRPAATPQPVACRSPRPPTPRAPPLAPSPRKYKSFEANLSHSKRRLKAQVPEIEASLKVVRDLAARKAAGGEPATTHFLLADQLYARATVAPEDKVCLWLGANVMLEYSYAEADALLAEQLAAAKAKAAEAAEDLDFVRDQIVVTEVNMARVFNFDVIKRRAEKKKAGAGGA